MEDDFTISIDDAKSVLSAESEFVLTELSAAQHMDAKDRLETLNDAMSVADRYVKMFEAVSGFEQKRMDAEIKQKELDLKAQEIELKNTELETKGEELDIKRSDLELKAKELDAKIEENSENAVRTKRAARIETIKSIGDIALKCGLLFAQGALYVWGVNKTFDFEGFHTASTSIGRSMLNNVTSLFIKK